MKLKNKLEKSLSLKLHTSPKIKKFNFHLNKSKKDVRAKTNDKINEEEKLEIERMNNFINSKKKNNHQKNYIFNYDYISENEKNKNFKTKKDETLSQETETRIISIESSLNLSNRLSKTKLSLSKRRIKKLSLSILSLNSINSKLYFNQKIKNGSQRKMKISETLTLSSIHQKSNSNLNKNKRHNIKNMKQNFNLKSFKSIKKPVSYNTYNCQKNRSYKNLFRKFSSSRNQNNNKKKEPCFKHKSYNSFKHIISEKKDINTSLNIQNNEITEYIKVNKLHENKESNSISIEDNLNLNHIKNETINITNCNKSKNKEEKTMQKILKNNTQKIINFNNDKNDYYNNIIKNNKNIKNNQHQFNVNKTENHNIFLDKNYQNRFNQKTKNNKLNIGIFTNEKQKEFNTIIIKKKNNNHLNNLLTISTTNSSNSSNQNNNNTNRNWVHRLYDDEIKKQKKRDKMIYLLRKSILNETSPNKNKKEETPKTKIKDLKYGNYKNNFDGNFDIINLFLSDYKKQKNKGMKRNKTYNNYQYKRDNYDNDNENDKNNKNNEIVIGNNIEKKKIKLLQNKKSKNIKLRKNGKKFLFLYNEELINEEDEEKEKDEDE